MQQTLKFACPFIVAVAATTLLTITSAASAQSVDVPLTPDRWTLTGDSLRFETYLGRPSLYLRKGVVIANDVSFRNGTVDFDMALGPRMNWIGLMFHVQSSDAFELVFFRYGATGTMESVQYQPVLMENGTWEIFHGDGANGIANLTREKWLHVRIDIAGPQATVYFDNQPKPVLTVPNLALGPSAGRLGFWTGAFGSGGYVSNVRYTPDSRTYAFPAPKPFAPGTIADWELSEAMDASSLQPTTLPDLRTLHWDKVHAEPWKLYRDQPLGLILINRYRRGPNANPPSDPDSVMGGHAADAKVVLARTSIESDRDQFKRMHFGYSDGVTIYCNGNPLFFGMNPYPFRELGGVMETQGEAVYLPLSKGRNEIVFAVTEFFAGWGYWARLDP
jgi:hypothetical protein